MLTSATLAAGGDFDFLESRLGLAGHAQPGHDPGNLVRRRSTIPPSASSAFPTTFRIRARTRRPTTPPLAQAVTDLAYAVGRRAVRAVHQPRRASAGRAAAAGRCSTRAGRCWCRGRAAATRCSAGFARRATRSCSGPTRSGKGWTCRVGRCAAWCCASCLSRCPRSRSRRRGWSGWRRRGEDGFMGYLLPHAALKLKQGFGRLIRIRPGRGRGGAAGPPGGHQALRPAGAGGAAPGRAGHRLLGAGAHQV